MALTVSHLHQESKEFGPADQRRPSRQLVKMFVTRAISVTNFMVASSALCFQVCVLYPWHKQLDEDFEALKKEHLRVLQSIKDNATVTTRTEKPSGIREMLGGLSPWKM
ncbi:hypothetical protein F4861DRAFT_539744 [Xylaria intraflava]|nr:hypothetical protein F4861DRAFT_539744 [Xylaria intraflava]